MLKINSADYFSLPQGLAGTFDQKNKKAAKRFHLKILLSLRVKSPNRFSD